MNFEREKKEHTVSRRSSILRRFVVGTGIAVAVSVDEETSAKVMLSFLRSISSACSKFPCTFRMEKKVRQIYK